RSSDPGKVLLDDVSLGIIRELQIDGRRPYTTIAKTVGLSEAAVRQRVQRLLDAGVMQIVAVTDPLRVGLHRQAMIGMRVDGDVPVIMRGEGAWVYDDRGKRYLDGLAGLFVSQVGHGRRELAHAMAKQAGELAYFPVWSYAHPRAVELAERLADLAPGD